MKKLTTLLSLILGLTVATASFNSQSAHAGVGTLIGGLSAIDDSPVKAVIGTALASGFIYFGVAMLHNSDVELRPFGIMLLILDAETAQPQAALEQHLATLYPFIDNRETVKDLAAALNAKIEQKDGYRNDTMVSLTEEETRSILATTDLSEEQIAQVVLDLN